MLPATTITYREARSADIEAMFELRGLTRENAISRDELAQLGITSASIETLLRGGGVMGRVCLLEDGLAGFCLGHPASGEVLVLAVRPDVEGRGVGRTLLEAVAGDLRRAGCARLWLSTSPDPRVRSYGFYRALGWRPTGQLLAAGDEILVLLTG